MFIRLKIQKENRNFRVYVTRYKTTVDIYVWEIKKPFFPSYVGSSCFYLNAYTDIKRGIINHLDRVINKQRKKKNNRKKWKNLKKTLDKSIIV